MRFRWFWLAALLSNCAAAGMDVAVSWTLGDNRLPILIQFLQHSGGAVGGVVGVLIGSRVAYKLGFLRTIILSSALEALGAVCLAAIAFAPDGRPSLNQAISMVAVQVAVWTAVGLGGPAWVSLVSQWPNTRSASRQVLLDSLQFQLGRTLGPLIGGLAIAGSVHAVQWTAAANAATFLLVMAVLYTARSGLATTAGGKDATTPGRRSRLLFTPELWAIAGIAVSVDGGRIYLARIMRGEGLSGADYSLAVSVLAASAVIAAAVAAARNWGGAVTTVAGISAMVAGLLSWSVAASFGLTAWLVGSALLGAGVSLAPSGLTTSAIERAGDHRISAIAGLTMTRTSIGAVAGAPLALVVGVMGSVVYLPLAAVLAGLALISGSQMSNRRRHSEWHWPCVVSMKNSHFRRK